MATQVYAVIYDDNKDFIIARKNKLGHFFHTGGGTLNLPGKSLNGGGKACFPGGKLEVKDPVAGALMEMEEETNVSVNKAVFTVRPDAYYREVDGNWAYWAVFFKAPDPSDKNLHQLTDILKGMRENLGYRAHASADVVSKKITKYPDIRAKYPNCPADDELDTCDIVNLKDINKYFNAKDNDTDWFLDMVTHLTRANKW